ncbi:LysM peptidoglycan-binding domain-containing protein [Chryseomicrobium sp. FSL W7-1435]|uniref:cell division suppressor protein YneA n=1 Tax=Chryseomicrobium sp. FSL W7-1435 TaxID=2921704 RepID=UPI00315A6EE5
MKNKTSLLYTACLAIIILFTFTTLHLKAQSSGTNEITISTGDSLWTLAELYVESDERLHWIDQVMQLNYMTDSKILVGQRLTIPSEEQFDYLGEPTQLAGTEQ